MKLAVKGWAKFQHFKDRKPPWIKLYRDILDDKEWHRLDAKAAKALVMLWLIASESDGVLPDRETLAFRLRTTETEIDSTLSKLSHWLLRDDIDAISTCHQGDAPETETEVEREAEAPTVLVGKGKPPRPPDCPTEALIALYHEHLPMLPRVEVLNDSRKRTLSARWREVVTDADISKAEDVRAAGLEWFGWYFGHAAKSKFLTGKSKDWHADFDFLMTQSKFAKVVEGSYHREAA